MLPILFLLEISASEMFHFMVCVQSIFLSSGYILLLFVVSGNVCGAPCNLPWLFHIMFFTMFSMAGTIPSHFSCRVFCFVSFASVAFANGITGFQRLLWLESFGVQW